MDPFTLLQADHERIRRLLRIVESGGNRGLQERALEQIRSGLALHTRIEESIVYPECEQHPVLRPLVARFYQQHDQFMEMLSRIHGVQPDGENPLLHAMIEAVEAHIREEDEELFPRARQEMPGKVLERIAAELEVVMARAGLAEPDLR